MDHVYYLGHWNVVYGVGVRKVLMHRVDLAWRLEWYFEWDPSTFSQDRGLRSYTLA